MTVFVRWHRSIKFSYFNDFSNRILKIKHTLEIIELYVGRCHDLSSDTSWHRYVHDSLLLNRSRTADADRISLSMFLKRRIMSRKMRPGNHVCCSQLRLVRVIDLMDIICRTQKNVWKLKLHWSLISTIENMSNTCQKKKWRLINKILVQNSYWKKINKFNQITRSIGIVVLFRKIRSSHK